MAPVRRIELLGYLLAAKTPLAPLAAALASYEWDSPPLVVLRREHVVSVLQRFLAGEVQAGFVREWADLVEVRDDIEFEQGRPCKMRCSRSQRPRPKADSTRRSQPRSPSASRTCRAHRDGPWHP